jgi:hypothetical protein
MQRVYSELGYSVIRMDRHDVTNEHSCAVRKHAQKHALN